MHVSHSLFVYFVSRAFIEPSLHQLDVFFYGDLLNIKHRTVQINLLVIQKRNEKQKKFKKAPKVLMPLWISASCMHTVYSDSTGTYVSQFAA